MSLPLLGCLDWDGGGEALLSMLFLGDVNLRSAVGGRQRVISFVRSARGSKIASIVSRHRCNVLRSGSELFWWALSRDKFASRVSR